MSDGPDGADPDPLVTDAENRKQVKEAKEKAKLQKEQELDDVRFIVSDPRGRRFFHRYLKICKVWRSTFTGEQPLTNAFNEGMRAIGTTMIRDMALAQADAYFLMTEEAKQAQKK